MMHIPKNAKLFLCEQLRRRSTLTQCSASPPFAPWAKVEPCQLQGWRRRGLGRARVRGLHRRARHESPCARTSPVVQSKARGFLWLPAGLGLAAHLKQWRAISQHGQGGLGEDRMGFLPSPASGHVGITLCHHHPPSPLPSITITLSHHHPVVNKASESQKEQEEFGGMGRLSEHRGRGLQGEDPSPHQRCFAAHENRTPSLQQGVKHLCPPHSAVLGRKQTLRT